MVQATRNFLKTLGFVAFGSLFAGFLGCSKKNESPDELRMRLNTDPPSIDWTLSTDNVSKEVIEFLHEGLLSHSMDAKVNLAMAESWKVSTDGKTYTFKLRSGLKWSDGQPLTAQHYVDAFERVLNPKSGCEYAYFLFDVQGGEDYQAGKITDFSKVGAKAIDETTFEVTLRAPVAYWIFVPAFWPAYPIRKDVIATHGDKWTDPGKMVSAGMYKLVEYQRDSKIVLEKNEFYWDRAALDKMPAKVVFRVVKDDTTAVAVYKNGGFDIVRDLPPVQIQNLSKMPGFRSHPYLRGYYFGFNINDPAVKDVNIRKALAHAIDRKEFDQIFGPMIRPSQTWNHPSLIGYSEDRGLGFNPELARKLWAEAKDKPTTIEFAYDQKDFNKLVAENIHGQWKKNLGIDANLTSMEWKVYLKALRSKSPATWRMGWGADYPDPDTFFNLYTCKSGNNFSGFCSTVFDNLIKKAAAEQNPSERAKMYNQVEKILLEDDVVIVPLFAQTNMHLISDRLEGFNVNPMGYFDLKALRLKK